MGNDTNGSAAIECRNLWKIFGSRVDETLAAAEAGKVDKSTALKQFGCVIGVADVSFDVKRGEVFCIMGLSGSGKSTILRHVNRLIEPTAGSVLVDGQDVMGLDDRSLRALRAEKIGMVFQHMALWPHKTITGNVAFGLEVQGADRKACRKAAEEALETVGLGGWGDRYPDELSGGMQQRVGLARALAADPDILLMDEPFSALDPLIRRDLQDEFLELSARARKTTLFITHDLDEAMRIGHRIAVMKDGRVDQIGTPEAIVLRPETDYVARFVGSISTLKYLSASEITVSGDVSPDAPVLGPDSALPEVIGALANGADHLAIRDGDRLIGRIGRSEVLAAVGRDLRRR
ncbi:MAG: betaine/proline/choline family ABC transporter ATP-binding protein [Boseongicola sp. SB0664_bin_43]|uniref:Quaternary amine transport ATP-binding protein n=1 Tax=Boseongicola sp. SB0664_bin_43 TaxID=2604844 RepID=A0A6B0Y3Z3_9RHOB|nr:betaine/proline/choline family ABC transporter ATP-binding protein [Boseongicola sp. SB0664_bin_43]